MGHGRGKSALWGHVWVLAHPCQFSVCFQLPLLVLGFWVAAGTDPWVLQSVVPAWGLGEPTGQVSDLRVCLISSALPSTWGAQLPRGGRADAKTASLPCSTARSPC